MDGQIDRQTGKQDLCVCAYDQGRETSAIERRIHRDTLYMLLWYVIEFVCVCVCDFYTGV